MVPLAWLTDVNRPLGFILWLYPSSFLFLWDCCSLCFSRLDSFTHVSSFIKSGLGFVMLAPDLVFLLPFGIWCYCFLYAVELLLFWWLLYEPLISICCLPEPDVFGVVTFCWLFCKELVASLSEDRTRVLPFIKVWDSLWFSKPDLEVSSKVTACVLTPVLQYVISFV